MKTAELLVETSGYVRVLTINRPERSNALTPALALQLKRALEEADGDPEVRAVVISGAGERTFCAGADLKELTSEEALSRPLQPTLPLLYAALLKAAKPVVAAMNGTAVGGGFELALCCDIRIAAESARFGLPVVILGMGPRYGSVLLD